MQQGLVSAVDGKAQELRDCLERHRADHDAAHSTLHNKVRNVESSLVPQLREMDLKIDKHRSDLRQERDDGHAKLMDLIRQHGDNLARVTGSQQDDKKLREQHQSSLNDRLDRLDSVQGQLTKKLGNWEEDLNELRELVGGEKTAREAYHGSMRSMQDSIKRHFGDEKAATR